MGSLRRLESDKISLTDRYIRLWPDSGKAHADNGGLPNGYVKGVVDLGKGKSIALFDLRLHFRQLCGGIHLRMRNDLADGPVPVVLPIVPVDVPRLCQEPNPDTSHVVPDVFDCGQADPYEPRIGRYSHGCELVALPILNRLHVKAVRGPVIGNMSVRYDPAVFGDYDTRSDIHEVSLFVYDLASSKVRLTVAHGYPVARRHAGYAIHIIDLSEARYRSDRFVRDPGCRLLSPKPG